MGSRGGVGFCATIDPANNGDYSWIAPVKDDLTGFVDFPVNGVYDARIGSCSGRLGKFAFGGRTFWRNGRHAPERLFGRKFSGVYQIQVYRIANENELYGDVHLVSGPAAYKQV